MPERVDAGEGSDKETEEPVEEDVEEKTESETVPKCATQKDEVTPLLHKRLSKGDVWYLVDVRWTKQWKKYVGFDSWDQQQMGTESAHPGPLDTTALFKEREQEVLKDHLMEDLDYSLVPEEVWKKLATWYGIDEFSKPIPRKVVEHGLYVKHCKVEVYLVEFKLTLHPDVNNIVMKKFSRSDTIRDVIKMIKEVFSIPEDKECRVWHKYMLSSYELLPKLEESVQDSGLYTNQLLMLEQKKDDDSWPRDTVSYSGTNMSTVRSSDVSGGYGTQTGSVGTSYPNSAVKTATSSSGSSSSSYFDYGQHPSDPGVCGLSNLGNTCFMNAAIQCLSNTFTLTDYFLKDAYRKHINEKNPLGMGGNLAKAYGSLLHEIWSGKSSYTHPRQLKATIGKFAPQFIGYAQHDSQELLAFLLDGLHEDLNQVLKKPYVDMDLKIKDRSDKDIAGEAWKKYMMRNKSVIVKLFQGQLKSTLVCPDCKQVSRIFDPFMFMSLPLPVKKERSLVIHLVRLDPTACIEKVRVTVPKGGQINSLVQEVSTITGVASDKMVVIDVYNCRFHKIFDLRESITHIMDRDDIFCYEVPIASANDPDQVVIPVYNREKVVRQSSYNYGNAYTNTYHQLFGVPLLVAVPRENLTYRKLYTELLTHMKRYVKRPSEVSYKPEGASSSNTPAEAGYDEVDEQNINNGGGTDTAMETITTTGVQGNHDDDSNMEVEGNTPANAATSKDPDMFTLCFVNGYGSQVLRQLTDDDVPLVPNNNTYVACDWDSDWKENCYNLSESERKVDHSSMKVVEADDVKKNIQLVDCAKLFTMEEKLGEDDAWYCPKCKDFKQASKKFDLWKLPEILVFHLKRFTYSRYWRDKLDVFVNFPVHELNLRDQVINSDDPDPVYDLFGVTNHYGGMGGGHYTAYCKNSKTDKWYHFDDSHVSETDESHVVTSAAYVLFYKRRVDGQPVLMRRMSSYTHRDSSHEDEPDKNKSSSVGEVMDEGAGAGASVEASEDDSTVFSGSN